MLFSAIVIFVITFYATTRAIVVPPPKDMKFLTHGGVVYHLLVTKSGQEKIIRMVPFYKVPKCVDKGAIKPVREHGIESNGEDESQINGNIQKQWKPPITPPDPLTQIRLSRFGKYSGYPRFYGLSQAYGFYGYNAGNDVNNNLPRGQYKIETDIDG